MRAFFLGQSVNVPAASFTRSASTSLIRSRGGRAANRGVPYFSIAGFSGSLHCSGTTLENPVNLMQRIFRIANRIRATDKLEVRTRDTQGRAFHYDLRICPASNPAGTRQRFLVRSDRTGPQGNTCREYRTMTRGEVQRLRHASC